MVNLSLNELKLIAKFRGIKGCESMSEDKLLSALNASESVKTIREIKKVNLDENKILRNFHFIFDPEKDHYEPKKAIFNMNVWEIKTNLSIKE